MLDVRTALGAARAMAGGVADLLLPRCCAVCERSVDAGSVALVCGRCWARAHELPYPRCDRCGHPQTRPSCSWCEQLPPFVRAARSALSRSRLLIAGWPASAADAPAAAAAVPGPA
ncbi:MAG: double zinc ribbon domain-containing protein [Gemmatimonadales bacterium]